MTNYTTIIVHAINRTGVLEKICGTLRTKMYNLETITACDSNIPEQKRITIKFSDVDNTKVDKLITNLESIVEVVSAQITTLEDTIMREICLIKVEKNSKITESIEVLEKYVGVVVYSNSEYFVAQVAGTTVKINQIISEFLALDVIMEIGRSGEVAMLK